MKYMAKNMLNIDTSTMGSNARHICYKYGFSIEDLLMLSMSKIRKEVHNKWFSSINAEYLPCAHGIKHMIGIKEERYIMIGVENDQYIRDLDYTNEVCDLFINFFCTL